MSCTRSGKYPGFSVLEAIIVIGLIALICAVSLPALFRMLQSYKTQTAATQMRIHLQFARTAAVKHKVRYQVDYSRQGDTPPPAEHTYVLQRDNAGTFVDLEGLDVSLPSGMKISNLSVAGPIWFSTTGRASTSGTITLVGVDNSQWVISVTPAGGVSMVKTN